MRKERREMFLKNSKGFFRMLLIFSLIVVLCIQLQPVSAAENTTDSAGSAVHAFYPSTVSYSESMQKYIDNVDSLSFAWSKIDSENPGVLNTTKGLNGNYGFYFPEDYIQPVRYAKSKGKSIQINIFMNEANSVGLLPYDDKRAMLVQGIADYLQKDISQGEGLFFDGVVIDFEGLRDNEESGTPILYQGKAISTYYTQFLTELKQKLEPMGKKLYAAVNPRLHYNGYDYKALLGIADRVILMAHDYETSERLTKDQALEFTRYNTVYGVVSPAPILKLRQALEDFKSSAANGSELSKVWLQIAFDSAQWRFDVDGAGAWDSLDSTALSREGRLSPLYKSIKLRVDNTDGFGENIVYGYNDELQSPFIQYFNTNEKTWNIILYEDSNSIAAKIQLAKAYGLGGISIWSLGNIPDYSDPKGREFHLDGWDTIISKVKEPYEPAAVDSRIVKFSDPVVEAAVRGKLYKPAGDITLADIKSIYRLTLPSGVKSLNDLQDFASLECLAVEQSDISNITALGSLKNLRVLYLQRNQISDISPLKGLSRLQILSLNGNKVKSIAGLSKLAELRELYLRDNEITGIEQINSLTKLRVLYLDFNKIKEIGPMTGLKDLSLLSIEGNGLVSIKGLNGAVGLKHLNLANNSIKDIQPLKQLKSLETLYLQRNSISSIGTLAGLVNLKELSVNGNGLRDIKALEGLTKLERLYLKENNIADIVPLKNLKSLKELSLDKNQITDLTPIAGLTQLTDLNIPENKIANLAPLKGLTALNVLSLNRNAVSDLSPLSSLTSLKMLYIKENRVKSLEPLRSLVNLQELYLNGNPVSDYSPVMEQYNKSITGCDFRI